MRTLKREAAVTAPLNIAAASKAVAYIKVRANRPNLGRGGLFIFVSGKCNDRHNQPHDRNDKRSETDHDLQSIFNLHKHHLPSGKVSRPPLKAILLCSFNYITKPLYLSTHTYLYISINLTTSLLPVYIGINEKQK